MQETTQPLPNFFIAGAPKTGTTSLYRYLKQHPQIYMSPVKEPCYFASEVRLDRFSETFEAGAGTKSRRLRQFIRGSMKGVDPGGMVADWEDYVELFKNVDRQTVIGEASVCYLWSPTAALNIRARIPEAKIVIILRDPAERAFSQYLQYAANGLVKHSFREQIERSARNTSRVFDPLYPFLEYGLYYRQVKAYLEVFPRANIRIYWYEEAWSDPLAFLKEVFRHLNVDSEFVPNVSARALERRAPRSVAAYYLLARSGIAPRLKALAPTAAWNGVRALLSKPPGSLRMHASDRKYLCEFYREDVRKLSSLLNRDLEAWLT